jgi:2',3'-cyclic-nucleotide 2'-phosphodiesterase (5'-nucleotidase family)
VSGFAGSRRKGKIGGKIAANPRKDGRFRAVNQELEISRRRFLAGASAWLGATAAGMRHARAAEENFRTISIFHTTDLHGHIVPGRSYEGTDDLGGLARCATCIRQWRRESPHSLLVDIGDVYQGTAESLLSNGAMMTGMFNRLGYDAWTLGNHDFDWGREVVEKNLALSRSPVLTGNIRVDGKPAGELAGVWKNVRPWTIREIGGFRIALVGLITPGLPYWLAPETLGGVTVEHPLEALRRSVAEARADKADAVVVLGHMGWRQKDDFANPLREILRQVPGVDVFLAGHTHQDQPSWKIGKVLCSQAGYHGIHCGRVDLTFDLASRKLIGRDAFTELMDGRYALDAAVMDAAAPELRHAAAQRARKLGTVTAPIPAGGAGNPLARLFCECFAAALQANGTPVDGVFHGTFGTGTLAAGEITVGDCWRLIPYENLLVTARLTARDLIELVREERRIGKSDRILWPFEIRLHRDGQPLVFKHRGQAVAEDAEFTIAFNSYDAQSGGRSMMFLREMLERPAARRKPTGIDTRGALIDGILKRGRIP